jgi:hypothetical protein
VAATARPAVAEQKQFLVVTDPAFSSRVQTRIALLGMTQDAITFADLASADPASLAANYRAIHVPLLLTRTQYDALQRQVAVGGVLERYANAGGTLVLNVGGRFGSQIDVAPGGIDFSGIATHTSEMVVSPAHPYINGTSYGSVILSRGAFGNWLPTDYGNLLGLPEAATVILANSDGPSMAEYEWGKGKVIVSTLGFGQPGFPDRVGAPWNNLLLYAGRWQAGSSGGGTPPIPLPLPTPTPTPDPTPRPEPEKVPPTVVVTNRIGSRLVRGPNGRSAYMVTISDALPSSGLAEIKVEGAQYNLVSVNGSAVAEAPLPYIVTFAPGSNVTKWELVFERAGTAGLGSLKATASDQSGNSGSAQK